MSWRNASEFKGIHSIVNLGPVLIGYFTEPNVLGNAYSKDGKELDSLIEYLPLMKQGWSMKSTVNSLMRIAMYHGNLQKNLKDLQEITPDVAMKKWFDIRTNPGVMETGTSATSNLLLPELGKIIGGYLESYPSLMRYETDASGNVKLDDKGKPTKVYNDMKISTFETMEKIPPRKSIRGKIFSFTPDLFRAYDFQSIFSLNYHPKFITDAVLFKMTKTEGKELKEQLLREHEIVKDTEWMRKLIADAKRGPKDKIATRLAQRGTVGLMIPDETIIFPSPTVATVMTPLAGNKNH